MLLRRRIGPDRDRLVSAALHAGLAPEHFAEATGYGLFFSASVVGEAIVAAAILSRPVAVVSLAGVVVALGRIVAWAVFRIVPPPGADAVEQVDLIGLITKGTETVALIACGMLWHATRERVPAPRRST